MEYTNIGDLRVSKTALGSMTFGDTLPAAEAEASMDYALHHGVNLLDTALIYGAWMDFPRTMGTGERIIGDYMKKRGNRSEIILATKGAHPNLDRFEISRVTGKAITQDVEESLKNLQTDYIDIYFLHRDDPDCDIPTVMETLHGFVKAGKIRVLGASNWTMARIKEANAYAQANGLTSFRVSQIEWSLAYMEMKSNNDPTLLCMDATELAEYRKGDIALMSYTAQARGFFSKYIRFGGYEGVLAYEKRRNDPTYDVAARYNYPQNWKRAERVKELSEKHHVPASAIVYSYLMSQRFPVIPVLGCSTEAQLADSLAHIDFRLTQEEIETLLDGEIV